MSSSTSTVVRRPSMVSTALPGMRAGRGPAVVPTLTLRPGRVGRNTVNDAELPAKVNAEIVGGDVVGVRTPAGGALGPCGLGDGR